MVLNSDIEQETIYSIPEIVGQYLIIFERLKREILVEAMEAFDDRMEYLAFTRHRKLNLKSPKPVSGYAAFKIYYAEEFLNQPVSICAKYFAAAWEACPHKRLWESYAILYNKRKRKVGFKKWFQQCKKIPYCGELIIIQQSFRKNGMMMTV
ncbi:hypothetical protein DASB73_004250 [Starmerella bacillaris]|uniref:Uncharacterized protein n=1 Tax=Starmerella bacillaris TaxID=1247836 RepID=A0AAV5RED3_STABA|nr:hypothetical protein DASB73_004250 [Starmerella bacillaris]